jgi:hypothetical protein
MAARCRSLASVMMPGPDRDRLIALARSLEEEDDDASRAFVPRGAAADRREAAE